MNWAQFKKNIGMRVQLAPVARSIDEHGNELRSENDDWIVESFPSTDVVSLRNTRTSHIAKLGKDHIYDFRSNPGRSTAGAKHGFLVLKIQIVLQGIELHLLPTLKPGERVGPINLVRQVPEWTPFERVDASQAIPPIATSASIQYKLWSSDATIPLMIRIAAGPNVMVQELAGPSGIANLMITEPQVFYVSFSHPEIHYEIGVLGYTI